MNDIFAAAAGALGWALVCVGIGGGLIALARHAARNAIGGG